MMLTSLRRVTLESPVFLQSIARHPAKVGSEASSPARSSSLERSCSSMCDQSAREALAGSRSMGHDASQIPFRLTLPYRVVQDG